MHGLMPLSLALVAMSCGPVAPSLGQGNPAQVATTALVDRNELPLAVAFEEAAVPVVDVAVTEIGVAGCHVPLPLTWYWTW